MDIQRHADALRAKISGVTRQFRGEYGTWGRIFESEGLRYFMVLVFSIHRDRRKQISSLQPI